MNAFVIIFLIVATVFAIATLIYVAVDIILEILKKKNAEAEQEPEPEPEPLPEAEPEPEIIESAPVEIPEDLPVPVSSDTGIEVIDVAWPESMAKNKIYKYDPDGEALQRGDTVLVPTFDAHRHGNILRTATVINGNYRIDSIVKGRVLKKIIRVLK